MVSSMMNLTSLPKSFWGYALESAARILNMVPTKKVDRTPYENGMEKLPRYPKETMGYYFYYPFENKIDVAQNAKFFENSLTLQEASVSHGLLEARTDWDLNEPLNYKAALSDSEYDKWLDAINIELQSMRDNQVWYLVDLLPNGRTVGSKWIFKKKTNMDDNVHTFKACLIAKGYTQTYSVDYGETFSPVAYIRDIRILLAITAKHLKAGTRDLMRKSGVGNNVTMLQDVKSWLSVDWKSAKQSTIAMSSTEAEYITAPEASMDVVWMRKFIDGFGVVMPSNKIPMEMLCDNAPAIAIANDPEIMKGARHYQKMPYNKHFEHAM
ncbi:zinc finger, CCHC-type containing protein [Tanacetum coccineum]